jgi:hypothetical protein
MDLRHEEKMPDDLYYAQDIFSCGDRSLVFVPKKGKEYLRPIKIPFDTYEKIKTLMHDIWERPVEDYTVVDRLWVKSTTK